MPILQAEVIDSDQAVGHRGHLGAQLPVGSLHFQNDRLARTRGGCRGGHHLTPEAPPWDFTRLQVPGANGVRLWFHRGCAGRQDDDGQPGKHAGSHAASQCCPHQILPDTSLRSAPEQAGGVRRNQHRAGEKAAAHCGCEGRLRGTRPNDHRCPPSAGRVLLPPASVYATLHRK